MTKFGLVLFRVSRNNTIREATLNRINNVVEKLSFVPISYQLGCVIQTFISHWTFLAILDSVAKTMFSISVHLT